ncbi:MAG: hypothetical protein M3R13_03850 [Armatimonadota bacterium]|nr:hypothetical protein [Armatimonadota bacterium]
MNWRSSLFIVIFALGLFWPLLSRHVAGDVGVYSYIGSCLADGMVPYRDAWDIKSPGIFFQYGGALLMLGHSDLAVVLADFLIAIGAAFVIYLAAERVSKSSAGLFASAAWLVTYNFMHMEGWFGQPETAAVLLSTILFYLALDYEPLIGWQCFFSGFVVGILLWYKLPFMLFAILLLPRMGRSFARNRAWEAIAPGFMGFVVAVLPVLILFMVTDSGRDLWEGLIVAPYLMTTTFTFGFGRQAQSFMDTLLDLGRWIVPVACLALVAITGLPKDKKFEERMTWGFLLLAMVIVVVQQRYLMYYWILILPPLSILAGIGASRVYHWAEKFVRPEWVRGGAIVLVMTLANWPRAMPYWDSYMAGVKAEDRLAGLAQYPTTYGSGDKLVKAAALVIVGDQLRQLTEVDDTILSFDMDPAINFYADRKQPTRFSYLWPLRTPSFDKLGWKAEFSKEIMRGKPKFIVVCRDNQEAALDHDGLKGMKKFPTLTKWFQQNYGLYVKAGVLEIYADHEMLKKSKLDLSLKLARLERLR